MINITFPDGNVRQYAAGTTALDVAKSISEGLARVVLAAGVNGEVRDLRPINEDARIFSTNGRTRKANTPSGTPRRTCWPKRSKPCTPASNSASGRAIENGFYYDVDTGDRAADGRRFARHRAKNARTGAHQKRIPAHAKSPKPMPSSISPKKATSTNSN
jgi:threonyl-tRNA synthetase